MYRLLLEVYWYIHVNVDYKNVIKTKCIYSLGLKDSYIKKKKTFIDPKVREICIKS